MANEQYGGLSDIRGNEPRRSFIVRATETIDQSIAKADRKHRVQNFRRIKLAMYISEGLCAIDAMDQVRNEQTQNFDEVSEQADNFFAWRKRLTTGDTPITEEVFHHALLSNPRRVIEDSAAWGDIRSLQEAAFADWAHTVEIPDSYFENRLR